MVFLQKNILWKPILQGIFLAVSVELKGVAQVTFSESSNNESIKYHAEQEYFNERILLSGDGHMY